MLLNLIGKTHMPRGGSQKHLSMCGIDVTGSTKSFSKKPNCKNCRRVMKSMAKSNKFYDQYL